MKKIFLFLALILFIPTGFTQTILYQDNMETYPVNSYLGLENPTWWATWSGLPGSGEDVQVKDLFSHSTSKSGSIDTDGGPTDAMLLLGEKFTGAYEVSWWMYIASGKCGYYNIQHFETPGTEYGMSIFFRENGTFEMTTGGNVFYGTYPKDTWFEVKHNIDLDVDYISLYVDGAFIHDWPFSYQVYYLTGTKQLGAIDFGAYAVTGSGESPEFYIDDILYKELPDGIHPTIGVDPASVAIAVLNGTTAQDKLSVNNSGETHLAYHTNIIYEADASSFSTVKNEGQSGQTALDYTKSTGTPASTPPGNNDTDFKLHYDGDHNISIGWSAPPVTVTVAARFPNSLILPYAGMNLTSVEMFIDNLNAGTNLCTVRIFGMGTANEPGMLLATEVFTPTGASWDTVHLTSPVLITGEDLWVGYTFTQTDPGIYIPGVDAGPNDPNGDFLNTGAGWLHLSDWPGFTYNWNIRANLEGAPSVQWLSVNPVADTIGPGSGKDIDMTFDATLLTPGQYHAILKLINNDPIQPQVDVPVTLDVVGVGIDEGQKAGILVYPNPAQDVLNVKSDQPVRSVTIFDEWGRKLYTGHENTIRVSHLSGGIYFIETVTDNGTSRVKFVKKP